MKRKLRKVLAGCMAFVMALSLLPASALAVQTDGKPAAAGGNVEPWQENIEYLYEGMHEIELTSDLLDPDTGEQNHSFFGDNERLELLDSRGQVVARSNTCCVTSEDVTDPENPDQIRQLYSVEGDLVNLSKLPAGLYDIRVSASDPFDSGNEVTAPCRSKLRIVAADSIMLKNIRMEGHEDGSDLEAVIALYGELTEEDLNSFTVNLMDGDQVVARTVTPLIGAEHNYDYDNRLGWLVTYKMQLLPGAQLNASPYEGYSASVDYSGTGKLVDSINIVGNSVPSGYDFSEFYVYIRPNSEQPGTADTAEIENIQILDPRNAEIAVTMTNLKPGVKYELALEHVFTNFGAPPYSVKEFTAESASQTLKYQLMKNGRVFPASAWQSDNELALTAADPGSGCSRLALLEADPYRPWLYDGPEGMQAAPAAIPAGTQSLVLDISLGAKNHIYRGKNDVVVLKDQNGRQVARCTDMELVGEMDLRMTLPVAGLKAGDVCSVYLNDRKAGEIRVSDTLAVSNGRILLKDEQSGEFWTSFGRCPVTFSAANSSGQGTLIFRDAGGKDAVVSETLTGVPGGCAGVMNYHALFSAESLAALTDGTAYTLVFRDANGSEAQLDCNPGTYTADVLPLDLTEYGSDLFQIMTDEAGDGTQTIPVMLFVYNCRNTPQEELDKLKQITVNDKPVADVTEVQTNSDEIRLFELHLDAPIEYNSPYDMKLGGEDVKFFYAKYAINCQTDYSFNEADPVQGTIRASHLPETGVYTGKVYQDGKCLSSEFPIQRWTDSSLSFDKSAAAGLEPGNYCIRVYRDGRMMDDVPMPLYPSYPPMLTISDHDDSYGDYGEPIVHTKQIDIGFINLTTYCGGQIRWAESMEALKAAPFVWYHNDGQYRHVFRGEDGPRTLYVELSKTGRADDTENVLCQADLWLNAAQDCDVQPVWETQGVYPPVMEGIHTIVATTNLPYVTLQAEFTSVDGTTIASEMDYVGATADGRYQFKYDLDLAQGVSNETGWRSIDTADIKSIRIIARGLDDYSATGKPVGYVLSFKPLEQVTLPQFVSEGKLEITTKDFTLRGFAAPNTTVSVKNGAGEPITVQTNERGYFETAFTGLENGDHVLTVTNPGGIAGEAVGTLTVNYTEPAPDPDPDPDPDPNPNPDPDPENPFTDVKEGDWYAEPVMWAVQKGITSGMTPTEFGAFEKCNRAQIVTFLWSNAGKPEPTLKDNPFTDVPEKAWYHDAVLWAVEKGITGGMTSTTFGPAVVCNRAQAMTFLWKSAGQPDASAKLPFTDVKEGAWYYKAVQWAVENGITSGLSSTEFGTTADCLRSQIVTFMYKALEG